VFEGIPGALQVAFYTVIPALLIWGAFKFADRVRNWERGTPDRRPTTKKNVKNRLRDFRAGAYMQTLLRDAGAGLMHSMIYFGFLALLGVTTVLELDHQLPESLKFLHGRTYMAYSFIGDLAGLVFFVGVMWAIVRRYVQRPYRIRIKSKPEHAAILGVFWLISVSGFAAEAFRIAEVESPSYEKWSFIGYPLASCSTTCRPTRSPCGTRSPGSPTWSAFAAFLILLPITMLRHIFTSPLNMYLKDRDRPKGAMRAMPNLTETSLESFGASVVEDFTWKQLLDTDACTMCGRCTSVCPAHATGKPLDPREIVLKTGEVMAASAKHGHVTPPLSTDVEITISSNSLFERITAEEIWACTSCRACDEICPVNIEILDKILDMRRYLSPDGEQLPRRARQRLPRHGEPGQPVGYEPGRACRLGRRARRASPRPGPAAHRRVPVLGGLRRLVRRQEQEGHPGDGQAAAPGRHRSGHPRPQRDVHGRQRPPLGQRVPVPDAGDAQHRDARRHGREEDHHPVPALLQHAEERVPPARRQLRGHPPHAAAREPDRAPASST
jgi:heterodisulfide reductase subunit C